MYKRQIRDNIVYEMVAHSGTWEKNMPKPGERFIFKFALEFGWGPNPRFFKDKLKKEWHGSLEVPGKLLGVETVSYTHLDVYKRQHGGNSSRLKGGGAGLFSGSSLVWMPAGWENRRYHGGSIKRTRK